MFKKISIIAALAVALITINGATFATESEKCYCINAEKDCSKFELVKVGTCKEKGGSLVEGQQPSN